jgi:hypothetical protein
MISMRLTSVPTPQLQSRRLGQLASLMGKLQERDKRRMAIASM